MKKFVLILLFIVTIFLLQTSTLRGSKNTVQNSTNIVKNNETSVTNTVPVKAFLSSTQDIDLHDVDGNDENYAFTYNGEEFSVFYEYDNWHVYDSYKITKKSDIIIICQAFIDIHPIHGKDLESFRTAEDMADEWVRHNFAYFLLPEGTSWKENAKDVDLDPKDQNATLIEMYKKRK